jgi:hypothetical protein
MGKVDVPPPVKMVEEPAHSSKEEEKKSDPLAPKVNIFSIPLITKSEPLSLLPKLNLVMPTFAPISQPPVKVSEPVEVKKELVNVESPSKQ